MFKSVGFKVQLQLTAEKWSEFLPCSTDQEIRLNWSKIVGTKILQIFKLGLSLQKCLGFHSNSSTYKRETLITFLFFIFWRLVCYSLWDLRGFVPSNYTWIYWSKIYNQALVEHSCKKGCLCWCKSKERSSPWIRSLHVVVSVNYYMR